MSRALIFTALVFALALLVFSFKEPIALDEITADAIGSELPAAELDFPSMNATVGMVRLIELCRAPRDFAGKTIRVAGEAIDDVDELGRPHYGIAIYDSGGCCPLAMIEYVGVETNAPPQEGERIVLSGTIALPSKEAYSEFIITGATVRLRSQFKSKGI